MKSEHSTVMQKKQSFVSKRQNWGKNCCNSLAEKHPEGHPKDSFCSVIHEKAKLLALSQLNR